MARANDNGWDFVKAGCIFQYKEEGCVAMVKVLEDHSTAEYYNFKVMVLASAGDFPEGAEFDVVHSKNPGGYWSGMLQFYESAEYIPLPIGKPWPKALPGHEYEGLK